MIQYMCFYFIVFVPSIVRSKSKILQGRWLPQFSSNCLFMKQYMCFYFIVFVPSIVPPKSKILQGRWFAKNIWVLIVVIDHKRNMVMRTTRIFDHRLLNTIT